MTHKIATEDRELIARIAFEAEGIAVSSVRQLLWSEADDNVKAETLQRLDRVLDSLDPSIFGKVARSVATTLIEVGLVVSEEPDEEVAPVDARQPERDALVERPAEISSAVLEAGASPDDLLTAGTPEEGLETYPGEAAVAQPNHHQGGGLAPELEVAVRGDIALPDGITQEEADRLAREADEERELDELTKPDEQ